MRAAAVTLPCALASTPDTYDDSNGIAPNLFTLREEQLAVHPVLELADVPRPVVLTQPFERGRMQALRVDPVLAAERVDCRRVA